LPYDMLKRLRNDLSDTPKATRQDLSTNWKVWLWIVGSLLVATIAWLLGYD
jgi:hypothetical protein